MHSYYVFTDDVSIKLCPAVQVQFAKKYKCVAAKSDWYFVCGLK